MATLTFEELQTILNPISIKTPKVRHFTGISIDSRSIKTDEIFVAIKGKRFNGHDFIEDAFKNGAALAITEKKTNYPYLLVENTLEALAALAAYNLKKNEAYSIAITGSSGKTTTKDLLCSMLDNCHKTYKNENNIIGVCKTLLGLKKQHDVCVVEVGTNHIGEIPEIARFFKPDMVVFTNIGRSHLGNFGSLENILKEKSALISDKTVVIYNYDDKLLKKRFDRKGIGCSSCDKHADVYLERETSRSWILNIMNRKIEIDKRADIPIESLLLSVAAASTYKSDIEEKRINEVIRKFKLPEMRMEKKRIGNTLFILDCYNANPDSMKYAIERFARLEGKKLAVLGDMLELGEFSQSLHKEIGELLDKYSINLLAYGNEARHICDGTDKGCIFLSNKTEAVEFLREHYKRFDAILIKGSRAMKMEEIFEMLKESEI